MGSGSAASLKNLGLMANDPVFDRLQRWYLAQCDGDWEHSYGVYIDTLDNPGWSLSIDLVETALETMEFDRREEHRSEHDWFVCWRDDRTFRAASGPLNLLEVVDVFLAWVGSA
jgi:hypothetical protein